MTNPTDNDNIAELVRLRNEFAEVLYFSRQQQAIDYDDEQYVEFIDELDKAFDGPYNLITNFAKSRGVSTNGHHITL